jgi:glutamine amidotransferase
MRALIIDYNAGNVESVFNALCLVAPDFEIKISNKISDLENASHIILPGVGAFGDCMENLRAIDGLIDALKKQIMLEKKPFFGICVGMQVLANKGFEDGEHEGLGFIEGSVKKIIEPNLKIPHMGWNEVNFAQNSHPFLSDIKSGEHFYFANSYHFICKNADNQLASFNYGLARCGIIAKDNIFATQFHPEKSGEAGLKLLKNFLKS